MDYEKKYKEALEYAEKWIESESKLKDITYTYFGMKDVLVDIFSELKESEDERIRGAIIDHLKDNNLTEWAAWLEKQKEKYNATSGSDMVNGLNYEQARIQQEAFADIKEKLGKAKLAINDLKVCSDKVFNKLKSIDWTKPNNKDINDFRKAREE